MYCLCHHRQYDVYDVPQGARATRSAGEQSRQRRRSSRGVEQQFAQAGRAGRVSGEGRVQTPLLATQVVGIAYPGDILAMVTTRGKALARRCVGTQTEAPTQERGCPGLWLQGGPEPGARTGGQQRQRLCSVRAGE